MSLFQRLSRHFSTLRCQISITAFHLCSIWGLKLIHLTDSTPSRQQPYRIPKRLVSPLKEGIEMMKQLRIEVNGVVPSSLSWRGMDLCMFVSTSVSLKFDAYPMQKIGDLLEWIGQVSVPWTCVMGTSLQTVVPNLGLEYPSTVYILDVSTNKLMEWSKNIQNILTGRIKQWS